jgi:hypothetical protein
LHQYWIKDLNIRPKIFKQLQEVGNTLECIGIGKDAINRTPMVQHLKARMNIWGCIKRKSFCTSKETVIRIKRQATEWEKIFARYSSNKGLIYRIYREFKKT